MSDVKELISALAAAAAEQAKAPPKSKWDNLDVEIEHEGRSIKLPADPGNMPTDKAIEALQRKLKDEMQDYNAHEIIDAEPHDAAVAFVKAMRNLYGWASPVPKPGFFGPQPPQMISVKTGIGADDVVQCPLGSFQLPGIDRPINTTFDHNGKNPVFVIYGKIKKKDRHLLLELAVETRRLVKEESIYRGKALRLGVDENGSLDMNQPPEFMDVTGKDELIFDEDIQSQIDTSILTVIRATDACRKNKIPLKRGVLLEGPYGTGKSLTARQTARVCEENGWTFILLDRVQGLRAALEFANRYSPAVVFAEDIDRIASERDEAANDLINTIDGVLSKRAEVMTILTTNFAEKLNPVILRPGRLDAVISLRAPSDAAVEKLLRVYAGKLLDRDADVSGAAKELSGQIPASIRECVERAKLGMVGRDAVKLADSDLVTAAKTMKNHLALLNRDLNPAKSKAELFMEAFGDAVKHGLNGNGEAISLIPQVDDRVRKIAKEMGVSI